MKKVYLTLILFLSIAVSLQAQVIASEDFDYTVGGALEGANGGAGWASGWVLDGPEQNVTQDTIKNYRTGKASGTLLRFSKNTGEEAGNIRYLRQLTTPLTDDGNEYWLAFTMQIDSSGGNVTNLILTESTEPNGASLDLVIGKIFNGNLALGPSGAFQQTGAVDLLRPNWLVAKISYSGGEGDDVVSLFVNPDPGVVPADEDAILTYTGTGLDGKTLNSVLIRAEANPPNVVAYDDIYIGNTYADVAPSTAEDIQQYLPVSEGFNYTAGEGLDGQGAAGDGWNGAWTLLSGPDQVISADSIANPELLFNTGGNSLLIDASLGNSRMSRRLENRYVDHGEDYWFSFNVNFTDADADGGELVMIIADTTFAAGGGAGQPVSFGKINSSDSLGILSFGNPFGSVVAQDGANGSHWMVAKLEMSGDTDADTIRLFINPSTSSEPAVGTEVGKFTTTKLNNGFQAIGFKNGGGITKALVDDFYLALDFADVVPSDIETFTVPDVAFEQFDYPAEDSLDMKGAAENGWAGPWTLLSGSDQPIVEGGIQNSTLLRQTSGNSLFLDARSGSTRFKRELATPYLDNGSNYWFAFHAEFDSTDQDNGELVVMLVDNDSEDFGAGGGNGQFVAIGKTDTPGALGILSFGGFSKVQVEDAADDVLWLVAKVETNGGPEVDSVRLYVNPDPGEAPEEGSEVLVFPAPELNGGFQGVGFKFTGGASKVKIDDIFLGNLFSDIVPEDLEALANPDPAFEKFDYTAGGNLETNGDASNGWAGPWEKLSGAADATIAEGGVQNTTIFTQTTGNSLSLDANDGDLRYVRSLASNYDDNGLTYWLGFHTAFDGTTEDGGVVNVMLVNNELETFGASGGNGQFVAIGKSNAANTLGVLSFGPFGKVDVPDQDADGKFWLVARIETSGNEAADSVRLYIDPTPGATPVLGTEVAVFAASDLNGGFRGIGFKQDAGATRTIIDDIYVGNSFDEITPPDLVDISSLFQAGETFESFAYTATENLDGSGTRADGWGGPWEATSGAITIEAESITSELALSEGNKGYVNFTTDVVQYDRELSARFEDDSSRVWMSFLMDVRNATDINAESKVVLMDGDTEVVGFGRVGGFNAYGISANPSFAITNEDSDGIAWFLIRIDFSNDENPETVRLWINYDQPDVQPVDDEADIILEPSDNNAITMNNGFDGIRITGSGTPSVEFAIDEIRLGFNYADASKLEEETPDGLIARDQFRYPAGESLVGLGPSGTQWGGSWAVAADGGGPAEIVDENLTIPNVAGKDNSATLFAGTGSGAARFTRTLATPISDDGNEYWFSFIGMANAFVCQGGFGDAFGGRTVLFGKKFSDLEVSILDLDGATALTTVAAEQTNWYVAKVEFSGDAEADTVLLWLNPDPSVEPDRDFPDAKLAVTSLNGGIAAVYFRTEGGVTQLSIDEVHIGTTFESIVPLPAEDPGGGGEEPVLGLSEELGAVNYPNPFRAKTTFEYTLEGNSEVMLSILDMQGREVVRLAEGMHLKGSYQITWDGTTEEGARLSPGIYLSRFSIGESHQIRRVVLLNE